MNSLNVLRPAIVAAALVASLPAAAFAATAAPSTTVMTVSASSADTRSDVSPFSNPGAPHNAGNSAGMPGENDTITGLGQ